MWGLTVPDFTLVAGTVVMLVFLEGLLSADNALVLAVMVRHLPRNQQGRALRYGIFGAFGFRLIAVLFASTLLRVWAFKVVGGIYLLYLAISHLVLGDDDDPASRARAGRGFWATVVLGRGGRHRVLDRLDRRGRRHGRRIAGAGRPEGRVQHRRLPGHDATGDRLHRRHPRHRRDAVRRRLLHPVLLDRFPGLASGAYYLVAWIGLKLVGSGFHDALNPPIDAPKPAWHDRMPDWAFRVPLEMPWWLFWAGMVLIVVVSLVVHPKHQPTVQPPLTEEEILA